MMISMKRKIGIIGIGSISTLLALLMIETFSAQIISDYLIGHISDNLVLFIIIFGIFIFSMVISVIVGYFITQDISQGSVYRASILSLAGLILFLFTVCNIALFFNYPNVYSGIHGFEIVPVFPQVLVKFSIYILNDVFNLFILEIIVYYLFFVLFLEKFYQHKVKYRE